MNNTRMNMSTIKKESIETDGLFKMLPKDIIYFLLEKLHICDIIIFCSINKSFRSWQIKNDHFIQKIAHREIVDVAPYTKICGSYFDTYKLINQGQNSFYNLSIIKESEHMYTTEFILSNEIIGRNDAYRPFSIFYLNIILPGLMLENGDYWIFGQDKNLGFPTKIFKTKDEVKNYIKSLISMEKGLNA